MHMLPVVVTQFFSEWLSMASEKKFVIVPHFIYDGPPKVSAEVANL